MSDADSGHWFHRTSEAIQRWLASEPKSALTEEAMDAVVGAGGIPEQDDVSGDFRLRADDEEYIRELRRAGIERDDTSR